MSIHECVNMSVYMCNCVHMCENGVWEHVYVGMHFVSVYVRVWIYVYIRCVSVCRHVHVSMCVNRYVCEWCMGTCVCIFFMSV